MVQSIIIYGLLNGGVFCLLAVGFSVIFGVARIFNMAHTAFYMIAAYIIYFLAQSIGLNIALSVGLAAIATTLLGLLFYVVFIDRIREHETAVMMVTVALALAIQEVFYLKFGGIYRGVPSFVSGSIEIAGVSVLWQQVLTLGIVALCLVGIWIFFGKTKVGTAIRASSQDREMASLLGIDVSRICLIAMGVSVFLAAISGAVVAPLVSVEPAMWMAPLVTILAIVVLGGLGTIWGTVAGAFILAFVQSAVVFLVPSGSFLKEAVALVVMVLVLLVKPEGLFGTVFEEERL